MLGTATGEIAFLADCLLDTYEEVENTYVLNKKYSYLLW